MEIKDKRLFLKYALPCATTLVKRGWIKQEDMDRMLDMLVNNKEINVDLKKIFVVASSICSLIAMKAEKKEIDSGVIRDYFWNEHDYMVDKRYEEMKDFDPEECRVYSGKVLKVGEKAEVMTPKGTASYRKDLAPEIKEGDYVVMHYDFIVEKITKETAKLLWDSRQSTIKDVIPFSS